MSFEIFLLSCSPPEEWSDDVFTDSRDGKTYRIIELGSQVWMAENLNYNAPGSKCYDDDPANCDKYGRLYDWATSLNVCPEGWHLPTEAEWTRLADYVGDNSIGHYGFSTLLGGIYRNGTFEDIDSRSDWWGTIDGGNDGMGAYTRGISSYSGGKMSGRWYLDKSSLISVRCIKGEPFFNIKYGENFIDERDSQNPVTYKTVVIGEQTWMAANLDYYVEGSKCHNNYPDNCEKYGRLYNWEMAMAACPEGWHLPTDEEWATLSDFAGSNSGTKLKSASGWNWNDWDNIPGNGTDNYGFSALPDGPGGPDGDFSYGGNSVYWWSSTGVYSTYKDVYFWIITYKDADMRRSTLWTTAFLSVRCIKD